MNNIPIWQQHNWQHLVQRYQNHNLPHALLFSGSEGLGKLSFAINFAKLLLCKNNTVCNNCKSCMLFNANNHPDLFLIQPPNKTSNSSVSQSLSSQPATGNVIKIEQIRELISNVSATAHQGGLQIVIIDQADAMNKAAANALLKTLEEPSDSVVIILISSQPSLLPSTVLSRCQRVAFHTPSAEICHEWLQQQLSNKLQPSNNNGDIDVALRLAYCAPLFALRLLESNQLLLRNKFLQEFFAYLSQKSFVNNANHTNNKANNDNKLKEQLKTYSTEQHTTVSAIKMAENYANNIDINFLLIILLSVVEDLIKQKLKFATIKTITIKTATITTNFIINQDFIGDLKNLSFKLSIESLFNYRQELLATKKILATNIALNKQLLLENLLLKAF